MSCVATLIISYLKIPFFLEDFRGSEESDNIYYQLRSDDETHGKYEQCNGYTNFCSIKTFVGNLISLHFRFEVLTELPF